MNLPAIDSLAYKFLMLPEIKEEAIAEEKEKWNIRFQAAINGPYDSKYYDKAISPTLEDYDRILATFEEARVPNEEKVEEDMKELKELQDSI